MKLMNSLTDSDAKTFSSKYAKVLYAQNPPSKMLLQKGLTSAIFEVKKTGEKNLNRFL